MILTTYTMQAQQIIEEYRKNTKGTQSAQIYIPTNCNH